MTKIRWGAFFIGAAILMAGGARPVLPQASSTKVVVSARVGLDETSRARGMKAPKSIRLVVRPKGGSNTSFSGSVSIHDDGTFSFPLTTGESTLVFGLPSVGAAPPYFFVSIMSDSTRLYVASRPGQEVNASCVLNISPDARSQPELVINIGARPTR